MTISATGRIALPWSVLPRLGALLLVFAILLVLTKAQERPKLQPEAFIRANDRFALELLSTAHEPAPDRNIVLNPLPVSLTFAAILDGTPDPASGEELTSVFHWDYLSTAFTNRFAARMLSARLAKPKAAPIPRRPLSPHDLALGKLMGADRGSPEELWLSLAFLYRGTDSLSPDFIDRVHYRFGFTFRDVDDRSPQAEILKRTGTLISRCQISRRSAGTIFG